MDPVTVRDLKAKYSSKMELVKFLKTEGNVFLPHHKFITSPFVSYILTGKKKVSGNKSKNSKF